MSMYNQLLYMCVCVCVCVCVCGTYLQIGEQDFLHICAAPCVQASNQQGWKFRAVCDLYWIQRHCSFDPGASEEDEPSIR